MGKPADAAEVAHVLHALGDAKRVAIVELLSGGPRRPAELAAETGLPRPSISKHLRVLLDAGIVTDERLADDARGRVFTIRPDSVTAVRAWLDQLQAEWNVQLRSFKRHLEEKR